MACVTYLSCAISEGAEIMMRHVAFVHAISEEERRSDAFRCSSFELASCQPLDKQTTFEKTLY